MPVKYIIPPNLPAKQHANVQKTVCALNKNVSAPVKPVFGPSIKKQVKYDFKIEYFGNILK
jgi:hypothetical protein